MIDAFRAVLLNDTIDPALAALILTLPSENEMAEFFQTIDPDAIHHVANFIAHQLATAMADEFSRFINRLKLMATVLTTAILRNVHYVTCVYSILQQAMIKHSQTN